MKKYVMSIIVILLVFINCCILSFAVTAPTTYITPPANFPLYVQCSYNNGLYYHVFGYPEGTVLQATMTDGLYVWSNPISFWHSTYNGSWDSGYVQVGPSANGPMTIISTNMTISSGANGTGTVYFDKSNNYDILWYKDNAVLSKPNMDIFIALNENTSLYSYDLWYYFSKTSTNLIDTYHQNGLSFINANHAPPFSQYDYYIANKLIQTPLYNGYWRIDLKRTSHATGISSVVKSFNFQVTDISKSCALTGFEGNLMSMPNLRFTKVAYPESIQLYINDNLIDTFTESDYDRTLLLNHPDKIYKVGLNTAVIKKTSDSTVINTYTCTINGDANGNLPINTPYQDAIQQQANQNQGNLKFDSNGKPIPPNGSLNPLDWLQYYALCIGYSLNQTFVSIISIFSSLSQITNLFQQCFAWMPPEWIAFGTMAIALSIILLVLRR